VTDSPDSVTSPRRGVTRHLLAGTIRALVTYSCIGSEAQSCRVVTGTDGSGSLQVWEAKTGKLLNSQTHNGVQTLCLTTFAAEGRVYVASGHRYNDMLRVWNGDTFEELYNKGQLYANGVWTLHAYTEPQEGRARLVTGAYEGNVRILDAKSGEILRSIGDFASQVTVAHYVSPRDERLALVIGSNSQLKVRPDPQT
jgi:WD40 repeat protein